MEKTLNIYQRLNAVMKQVKYITKELKTVNGQYRFVSHDAVTSKLHDPLTDNGIFMKPSTVELIQENIMISDKQGPKPATRTTCKMEIEFINIDDPMDRTSVVFYGSGIDPSDKGIGKAVSYAVKYTLLKVFCLETGDDIEKDSYECVSKEENCDKIEISPKLIDHLMLGFLTKYADEDHALMKTYLEKYSVHWKKSMLETLEIYSDEEKFNVDFSKWRKKQLENS